MKKNNNMGGFISLEILPLRDVDVLAIVDHVAYLKLYQGRSWELLPIHVQNIQAPDVQQSDDNYSISANILLRATEMSSDDVNQLNKKIIGGCLIRGKKLEGEYYLYGNLNHPLFGSAQRIIGKKKTDLTYVALNLAGKTSNPPALIIDL